MNVNLQQNLFENEKGEVGVFQILPAAAQEGGLRDWIELAGGVTIPADDDDPCKIAIVDFDWYDKNKLERPKDIPANTDVFSPFYIYDSCKRTGAQDLNKYRMGQSLFDPYDANQILQRHVSWSDLERIGTSVRVSTAAPNESNRGSERSLHQSDKRHSRSSTSGDLDTESVEEKRSSYRIVSASQIRTPEKVNDSDDTENVSANTSGRHNLSGSVASLPESGPLTRVPYGSKDDEAILDFICANDLYTYTGGIDMWKKMAEECTKLSGRTSQSLKERFRKKILNNLASFKLSKSERKKFDNAAAERARGRRKPLK